MRRCEDDGVHLTNLTDSSYEILLKVFSFNVGKEKGAIPSHIEALMPKVNMTILEGKTRASSSEIVEHLKLKFENRVEIMSLDPGFLDDPLKRHKKYSRRAAGYLILQSACCGLPYAMNTLTDGEMMVIIKALCHCLKLLQGEKEIVFQLFCEYYRRLPQMHGLALVMPVVHCFLVNTRTYACSIAHEHISLSFTILTRVLLSEDDIMMVMESYRKYVLLVADILSDVTEIGKIEKDIIPVIFEGVLKLFRMSTTGVDDLKFAFLRVCMELMRLGEVEFPELFELCVSEIEGSNIDKIESPEMKVTEEILERTAIPIVSEWLSLKAPKVCRVFRALRSDSTETNRYVFGLLLEKSHNVLDTMNLDFIALMLLLLNHSSLKGNTLMDLVLAHQCFSLFFGDALFFPEITLFHYPQSPVVSLRSLSVRVWSSYMSDHHLCGFLISCFCKVLNSPELFAELFFLSQAQISVMTDTSMQGFIDCLGHELIFQQKWEHENRATVRDLTIKLYAYMLRNKKYRLIAANSDTMCSALFQLFNDETVLIQQCIDQLLPYCIDEQTSVYRSLVSFIRSTETSSKSFEQILMMIEKDLQSNKRDFLSQFAHSPLVPLILLKVKDFEPMTEGILTSVLLLLSSIVKVDHEYLTKQGYGYQYWEEISPRIIEFEYSEALFDCLCCMISRSTHFKGVESPDVFPIVETVLKSKYQQDFLELIRTLTERSCVQCFILYEMNFLELITDIIIGKDDDSQIQLLFDVFCNITNYICSRKIMFKVLRLLKPVSDGKYQNPKAKHVFRALQRAGQLAKEKETVSSILIFRSSSHFMWLPKAAFSDYSSGLVFSCWLKLPFLVANWIPLLSVSDHVTEISYSLNKQFFAANEIYTVPVLVPVNRWFNILLIMEQQMGNVWIYVDGKQVACLVAPIPNISQIETASLFKFHKREKGCCVFGGCAMWKGGVDEAMMADIMSTPIDSFGSLADKYKLLFMYTPRRIQRNKLINLSDKHIGDATASCDCFPFVKNLFEVFEASKGMRFLLSTFIYAELPKQDNTVTNEFLCGLMHTIFSLLMCSKHLHSVMANINGFNIIAHFLTMLQPELRDEKLWNAIREVNFKTSIPIVAQQFYQRIIFDISLWIHGDDSFVLVIIMHWNVIAVLEDCRLTELIPVERIIDIVYCLIISKKLDNEDIRDQVSMLLMRFASHGFSQNDIIMIIELMELESANPVTIVMLMEVLSVDHSSKEFVLKNLMASDRIVNHLDLKVRTYFILHYVKQDPAMLNEMLFIIVKEIPDFDQNYIDKMADQIYEVMDDLIIPFAIVISFFCDKQKEMMIQQKLCKGLASGMFWIGTDTSPFNIFLLTIRVVTGWTELGKRIGPIVAGSFEKLEQIISAIDIIEALVPVDDTKVTTFMLQLMTRATQVGIGSSLDFLELIADFMFFGLKEDPLENFDLCALVDRFAKGSFEHKLGLKIKDGKVRHGDVALILCQKIARDIETNETPIPLTMYIFLYYMYNEFGPELDEFWQRLSPEPRNLSPLLLKHPELCDKFGVTYDEQLMDTSFQVLEEFFAQRKPLPILSDDIQDLVFMVRKSLLNANMNKFERERQVLVRNWKKLWNSLDHERSPFLDVKVSKHYKRGCQFDSFFRPSLLTRNRHFDGDRSGRLILSEADMEAYNDHANSPILWSKSCERIRIMRTRTGRFSVLPEGFVFVNEERCRFIPNNEVKYVFWAWTNQVPDSFQIYTTRNKLFFIRIPGKKSHRFLSKLKKIPLPNLEFFQESPSHKELEELKLVTKWKTREISNFQYLIWLNLLSGRSFHNPSAYPIFPQVLADVDSLDLSSDASFQDLTAMYEDDFQYCSNAKSVSESLLRLEPFTTLNKRLHNGNLSQNMLKSWHDVANSANTGIPDFFFCPEFLTDTNGFGLGDVELPKWASSPANFVDLQRRALESRYVSDHLHLWIDTIWGVKQNVHAYDPHIRPDVWQSGLGNLDPEKTCSLCKDIGQLPQQLFFDSHSPRGPESRPSENQEVIVLQNIQSPVIRCHPLGKTFHSMKVFSILENGQFLCLRFIESNFEVQPSNSSEALILISSASKVAFFEGAPSFAFASERSTGLSVFEGSTRTIIRCQSSPHLGEVNCISVAGDLILTGGSDGCFALWYYRSGELSCANYLLAHHDAVTCCCASEVYNVAVTCSIDDTLLVSLLPKLQLLRVIELKLGDGLEPKEVHVTYRAGYIVLIADNGMKTLMRCYTINGIELAQHVPDKRITASCVAYKGEMDFVIAVEGGRTVAVYDAGTFQRITVLWQNHCPLLHVQYHAETNHAVVTTSDMKIQFIPMII